MLGEEFSDIFLGCRSLKQAVKQNQEDKEDSTDFAQPLENRSRDKFPAHFKTRHPKLLKRLTDTQIYLKGVIYLITPIQREAQVQAERTEGRKIAEP